MKKAIFLFSMICVLVMTGCGTPPDQSYTENFTAYEGVFATLGTVLNNFNGQLLDENYDQALDSLNEVKKQVTSLQHDLIVYAGDNTYLQTHSSEIQTILSELTTMQAQLSPVLEKITEENSTPTTEDTQIITSLQDIFDKIDTHVGKAVNALDAYHILTK